MLKAALIEIDGSHDECLYSQLLFLKKGGYRTTLICSENLRAQVEGFGADETLFYEFKSKGNRARTQELRRMRDRLAADDIRTIIFNSAHGHLIRDLLFLRFPKGTRFFGTLHGINKLRGSFTQWLISRRIRHYFLLNDYLVENLPMVPHKGLAFQSYYPMFFPAFPGVAAPDKPAGECWVCIPGQVEYKRRDYETLVRTFATLPEKPRLKFLLLGKSDHAHGNGPELRQLIDSLNVTQYFHFWPGFVDNATFHAWLQASDVVMPLIHPGNDGFEKYLVYQISGAYNLAFAYRKPLLMLEDFNRYSDFRENSLFYSLDNLGDILRQLPVQAADLQPRIYRDPKWTFEAQQQRYLGFIS